MTIDTGHPAADLGAEPGGPGRPGPAWKLILVGLLVTFVVLAVYDLVSVSSEIGMNPAAAASGSTSSASARSATAAGRTTAPGASAAPRPLTILSVAAFGPGGTADGDSPKGAARLLGGTQPWRSQWYATPEFGNLQSGTGLLLDMGKAVTVTSVRLVLGRQPGADMQVRVGNSAALDELSTVASATDVAGTVRLTVSAPLPGRYVLIWFTRLPPDGKGHYQVSVESPVVDGTAVDGTAVDGTAVDGTAVDGTAVDGTAVDGTAAGA